MLKLAPLLVFISGAVACCAVPVLVALSLGLGAYFIDLKEEHYLESVESLGGFIALVVDFSYIALTVILFGKLGHHILLGQVPAWPVLPLAFFLWLLLSVLLSLFIVRFGLRELSAKEY